MRKALILSDSHLMSVALTGQIQALGWTCAVEDVIFLANNRSQSVDYACVVMVIDAEFHNRYPCTVVEAGQFINSLSRKVPFYLLFEGQYKGTFASWMGRARRIFQQTNNAQRIQEAVDEIVKLESGEVSRNTFFSPVSYI